MAVVGTEDAQLPGVPGGLQASRDGHGGTVSDSIRGTEVGVVSQQQWDGIRQRHGVGQSISCIARELSLDRKTVRNCLREAAWQPYRREVARATLLDAHRNWIKQRAPQVGYSARILHQELRQRGFTGSYESVKLAVRPLRAEKVLTSATQLRFETAPGQQAQVDWGQVTVTLGAERRKVHVFVMTLGYSRRGYAEGFEHERIENLLSAHERAFAHFAGVCQTILYDRMRTVVLGSVEEAGKRRIRLNEKFEAFARHWGFAIRLCRPYRPQTKGKVESGVKYVKRNFVPGRAFHDLDDFNAQLGAWQAEIADVREHGTTHQRPIDRFAEEARGLMPVAGQPSFLQAMIRERVVAEDWLVSIDANRYSVPYALIGKTVQVTREGGLWVIRYRGRVMAEHSILAGRAQLCVKPEHGPGAASRNQRQRFAAPADPPTHHADLPERDVEIRDLAVYERLLDNDAREAA